MSTFLSTTVVRSAARKAGCLGVSKSALKMIGYRNIPSYSASAIHTTSNGASFETFGHKDASQVPIDAPHAIPLVEPLPAVALDVFEEQDDDVMSTPDAVTHYNPEIVNSSAGGRITNVPPTSSSNLGSATFSGRTLPSRKSGGGGDGGSGRHRCPKCGTSVTFRHDKDFDENTYYCATCSGWFLIDSSAEGSKGATFEEYAAKNGSDGAPTKRQDATILMQHVRNCFFCCVMYIMRYFIIHSNHFSFIPITKLYCRFLMARRVSREAMETVVQRLEEELSMKKMSKRRNKRLPQITRAVKFVLQP